MKLRYTRRFLRDYQSLPERIGNQTDKQLSLLVDNPKHPSLRIHKMQGVENIWEGYVTKSYRFTFSMERGCYLLRRVGTHDILNAP